YDHGGRRYYQWMARGGPLVRDLLPILEAEITPERDAHAAARFAAMCERYSGVIARHRAAASPSCPRGGTSPPHRGNQRRGRPRGTPARPYATTGATTRCRDGSWPSEY